MAVKITQKLKNIREELTALSFADAKKKKIYLNNLIDNGKFDNGTTGWAVIDGSPVISVDSGRLKMVTNSTDGWQAVYQTIDTVVGRTYKITATVENPSGNTGDAHFRGSSGAVAIHHTGLFHRAIPSGQTQTFTRTFTAENVRTNVHLMTQINNTVYLDNVSIQEIGDNMIVNGGFNYDGGWNKGAGWTISGGTASCDGSQTSNSSFTQSQSDLKGQLITGKQYTLTFTLSGHSGGGVNPHIRNLGYGAYITGNGTYTISLTGGTGNDGLNFYVQSDFVGSIDNVILSEGSHPVIQSLPKALDISRVFINGELAREGENYDYQIKTDGINQWLKPTVEPTATTETAVIGVYK